jgi:hypothetical protein
MRKILLALALATTVFAAASPVAAQPGRGGFGRPYPADRATVQRFDFQIREAEQRIEMSARRRAISGDEYRALREQARELRQRLFRFANDGLSRGEVQDIADRIDNLRDRLRDERRDGRRHG